jgi:hypothetical protein
VSRFGIVPALVALGAFAGAVVAGGPGTPIAAQDRPACSDGPGNAWDQVRGEIVDAIMPEWVLSHPFGSEGPDEIWDRCIGPALPPAGYDPGGDDPDSSRRGGTFRGDPHIVTQDDARYDFHAAGDFVLLSAPELDVEVQVRFRRFSVYSLFAGVAFRSGDSTVAVYVGGHGDATEITVDGTPIASDVLGWHELDNGIINTSDGVTYVELDNGLAFEAASRLLRISTPTAWADQFIGLQGNGDGDPLNDISTDTGDLVDPGDPDALYGAFYDSWVVEPGDSLFAQPFDFDRHGPALPSEIVTLADFDDATIDAAVATCTESGAQPGSGLEDCIFDVAVTDEELWPLWVSDARRAPGRPSVAAVGFDPAISERSTIGATGSVQGDIDAPFVADLIEVAAFPEPRVLRTTEPCDDWLAPEAVIIDEATPRRSLPLTCGAAHRVPDSAFTLQIMDSTGRTPSYAFAIAEAGQIDLGVLDHGQSGSGDLDAGSVAIAELGVSAGDTIYLATKPGHSCAVRVQIFDGADALVRGIGTSCLGFVPVELTGVAPFRAEFSAAEPARFDFQLTVLGEPQVAEFGAETTLDIDQAASATFDLVSGERVYIESVAPFSGSLSVIGPDGDEILRRVSAVNPGLVEARLDGSYTIEFRPDRSTAATQKIIIHRTDDDIESPAQFGDEVELAVTTPGQIAAANIELDTGDRIVIENVRTAAATDRVRLVGPDGAEIKQIPATVDIGEVEVEQAGTYSVVYTPSGAATGTQVVTIRRP